MRPKKIEVLDKNIKIGIRLIEATKHKTFRDTFLSVIITFDDEYLMEFRSIYAYDSYMHSIRTLINSIKKLPKVLFDGEDYECIDPAWQYDTYTELAKCLADGYRGKIIITRNSCDEYLKDIKYREYTVLRDFEKLMLTKIK